MMWNFLIIVSAGGIYEIALRWVSLDLTDEDWLGTDIALANVEDLLMIYSITKLVSDL